MKKSLSYLLLGVMAFSALAGCSKNGGGEASGSQEPASGSVAPTSDSGSVAPAKSDWTDDEKAIMTRLLYGQVLPFFEQEGAVVSAEKDEDEEETGRLFINGGKATASSMTAYAAKFTAAGYTVTDISASIGLDEGRAFTAEKSVTVESATKYVRAKFCPVSSTTGDPANAGVLLLVAEDPYVYEWPAAELAEELADAFGTETVIPDPEAPRYSFDSDDNGFYCTAFGAPAGYADKLTAFDVASEPGADGFYKADPKDGLFEAYFKYADGNLYLKITPLHSWPAKQIAGFFTKYSLEAFSFPQMTVEGSAYKFMEMTPGTDGPYFIVLIAGGTEAALSTYISGLDTDVYKISPNEGRYYIEFTVPDKGVANIMYTYMQGYGVVCYVWGELGALPVADFPAAAVATQLGELVTTDSVVPFSGCNSYQENEGFILCTCSDTSAYEGLISAYETALNTAGWTANGVQTVTSTISATHYSSPNHQIDIYFFVYSGSIRFYFRSTVFDVTEARKLADKVAGAATTDAIIGPAGVNAYNYNSDSFGEYLFCPAYADTATKLSTYVSALTAAGYVEAGEDSDGKIYNSPNKQFAVKPYIYNSLVIEVDFLPAIVSTETWVAENVAELVTALLPDGFDGTAPTIPALNGGNKYTVDKASSTITVEFASSEALTSAFGSYSSGYETSFFLGLDGAPHFIILGDTSHTVEFEFAVTNDSEHSVYQVVISVLEYYGVNGAGSFYNLASAYGLGSRGFAIPSSPSAENIAKVENIGVSEVKNYAQNQGYEVLLVKHVFASNEDAVAAATEVKASLDANVTAGTMVLESGVYKVNDGDGYLEYSVQIGVSGNIFMMQYSIWYQYLPA